MSEKIRHKIFRFFRANFLKIFRNYLPFYDFIKYEHSYLELIMKSSFFKVLTLSCILTLNYAYSYEGNSYGKEDYATGGGYQNADPSQKDIDIDREMYPYTKGDGRMTNENVIGIRIMNKKLFLLNSEGKFESSELQENFKFSQFDFFSKYPKLVSVDLHEVNLTRECLENLQKYLPNSLKSLILNSCKVSKKDYDLLVETIARQENLKSIYIIDPDCELGEATKITSALSNMHGLECLNLTLSEIGIDGCENIIKALKNCEQPKKNSKDYTNTLKELTLGFVTVEESESYNDLLKALGALKNLTRLEYAVLTSEPQQIDLFFQSLKNLKKLKSLKFAFDKFKNNNGVSLYHSAQTLHDVLSKNLTELTSLDISNMDFETTVMQLLSQAIRNMKKLEFLNVSGNKIDTEAAKILSTSIRQGNSIKTLMANNCEISADAFSSLMTSLGESPIKYLYLGNNNIEKSIQSLPVSQMKDLVFVDFSNNNLTYDDAITFVKSIKNHPSLRIVSFKNNEPIEKMSNVEKIRKNDELVEWKLNNPSSVNKISIFGL